MLTPKQRKFKTLIETLVKKELKSLKEEESYSKYVSCFDFKALRDAGISDQDIQHIYMLYVKIAGETGDEGSCVLGNGIKINGKIVIRSYSQGSIGLEKIKGVIIPYLEKKYPELEITYEWGHMD